MPEHPVGRQSGSAEARLAGIIAHARALIFDCDGTLVDSAPLYCKAWAAGFQLAGAEMGHDWYRARAGLSEHVLMDTFERDHHLTLDREAVVARMRSTFLTSIGTVTVREHVARIARSRHGRMPMAVASGGPRALVVPTLEACGLATLFKSIVTLDEGGRAKPEPDLFLEAARRLDVPPGQCVAFEDSEQGLCAARSAGMPVVDVQDLPG